MLKELAELRGRINADDEKIIDILSERIKYPLNGELYHYGNEEFRENFRKHNLDDDSCYFHQIYTVLLPLEYVCKKGFNPGCIDEVINLDHKLLFSVLRRVDNAAKGVMSIKHPIGLPVYVKDVEDRKHEVLGEIAEKKGIHRLGYHVFLQAVMDHTKKLEKLLQQTHGSPKRTENVKSVARYTTGLVDIARDAVISAAKNFIQLQESKTGKKFSHKVTKHSDHYEITVYQL